MLRCVYIEWRKCELLVSILKVSYSRHTLKALFNPLVYRRRYVDFSSGQKKNNEGGGGASTYGQNNIVHVSEVETCTREVAPLCALRSGACVV